MAQLSWKKALIEKAHTFLDYVVGWRGFYQTEDVATKKSSNTWVVPQKVTEVPQQNQEYFDAWYNFPYMVGFSGTQKRYRYPSVNKPYEFLQQYNENGTVQNQVTKVDYRESASFDWGNKVAGMAITGSFRNYAPKTKDLIQVDNVSETYWRVLYSANAPSYDVKELCSSGGNSYQQCVTDVNTGLVPFNSSIGNTVNAKFNTFYNGSYSQRFGRVLDKQTTNNKRTQVISFYVWTGFLNPEWIANEQPTNIQIPPCGGSGNITYQQNIKTLSVPVLSFMFQNTNDNKNSDWYAKDIKYNRTVLTLNLLDRSHTVAYESNDGDTISNADVIPNVQFETCPNDYVRIKIFLKTNPKSEDAILTGRYNKFEMWSSPIGTNATNILNHMIQVGTDAPLFPPSFNFDTSFTIYGFMYELSSFISGDYIDYVTGDYIQNDSTGSTGLSFNQVRLPNYYTKTSGDSYKDLFDRCKTFYFKLFVDSTCATPSQNLGGFATGGLNFAFFRGRTNTISGSYSTTSNISFTAMEIFKDTSTSGTFEIDDEYRYYIKLNPKFSPTTQYDAIEGIDYIRLNKGINSVAFSSENGNIVVNGKEYYSEMYVATNLDYWQFNGKRTDYILEYGLWEDNLESKVLEQLTNVK